MTPYRKIPRGVAVLSAAVLLGAGSAAAAQPLDGDGTPPRMPGTRTEAAGSAADAFTACQTVGTWFGLERFLCYRAASNLANERRMLPRPPTRPIVMEGAGFGWTDAGVGFRIGSIRSAGSIVGRLDFAYRFKGDREPAGWVVSLGRGFAWQRF